MVAFDDLIPAKAPASAAPKPETDLERTILEQALGGATFNLADEVYDRLGATGAAVYQAASDLPMESDDPYIGGVNLGAVGRFLNTTQELTDEARDTTNERLAQQLEERPVTSLASGIAGGVLTGGASATTKTGKTIANSLRNGNIATRSVKAGALGAGAASAAGAGAGSGLENRLESAGDSAVVGGLVGGALPVVGATASKVIGRTSRKGAEKAARKIARQTGEVPDVDNAKVNKIVAERLQKDFGEDGVQDALETYVANPNQSLAQAGGKNTRKLTETVARYPDANVRADDFFEDAIGAAPDRLKQAAAKTISPNVNYYDTVDDIVATGREKAAPLYDKAFKSNQAVDSKVINRILQTPEGKDAMKEAAKNLQNEMTLLAKPDKELGDLARELGMEATGSGVGRGLKLKTLDQVKRAMDGTINKAMRTGDEAQAQRIIKLKKGLVAEMDRLDTTGSYAKARRVSGDYLSNVGAAEEGAKFLRSDSQLVEKTFKNLGETEQRAFKVGVLRSIRSDIDNKADGNNVARIFKKEATRDKLKAVLNDAEYSSLMKEVKATDELYLLRNKVMSNSATADRLVGVDQFNSETNALIQDIATKGTVGTTVDRALTAIAKQFDGVSDKAAKEVADILFETDLAKKQKIVRDLVNITNSSGNSLRKTEAANKLAAFYSLDDALKSASKDSGALALPAGIAAGGASEGAEATQTPANPARTDTAPQQSPDISFDDLVPAAEAAEAAPQGAPQVNSGAEQASLLDRIALAESSGNPNAQAATSSASGLYQFTDSTWRSAVDKWGRKHGIRYSDKNDPAAQERMMGYLLDDNARILQNKGIEPSEQNLYFAHFMGAPAASKAINMLGKGAIAARSFPKAAKANRSVFFDGQRPRTVDEVYELITSKVA